MSELANLREEAKTWIAEHCPSSLRNAEGESFSGGRKAAVSDDMRRWFDACASRGWAVPSWPREYGGAGLDKAAEAVIRQEMALAGAPPPLTGMGVTMIGPTLLEYGTDDQKARHLARIANGETRWCQGYSEPNAGSDLAALQTRAVDQGDFYAVTGSKIWTSGANFADWIFCLVRTDPNAPKHDGISFVLFSMDDPGVEVQPIRLIAGTSPFCQCFFDDVKVPKADLIGQENRGWTIAKRLLQHERSSISGLGGGGGGFGPQEPLPTLAKRYVGQVSNKAGVTTISDPSLRDDVTNIEMDARAFRLTQRRSVQESADGGTPTFATSMFKYYSTELDARKLETAMAMMGSQGIGREGDPFTSTELETTRTWLFGKALTIAGGSSEVQLNIIAKRVLGLPD